MAATNLLVEHTVLFSLKPCTFFSFNEIINTNIVSYYIFFFIPELYTQRLMNLILRNKLTTKKIYVFFVPLTNNIAVHTYTDFFEVFIKITKK